MSIAFGGTGTTDVGAARPPPRQPQRARLIDLRIAGLHVAKLDCQRSQGHGILGAHIGAAEHDEDDSRRDPAMAADQPAQRQARHDVHQEQCEREGEQPRRQVDCRRTEPGNGFHAIWQRAPEHLHVGHGPTQVQRSTEQVMAVVTGRMAGPRGPFQQPCCVDRNGVRRRRHFPAETVQHRQRRQHLGPQLRIAAFRTLDNPLQHAHEQAGQRQVRPVRVRRHVEEHELAATAPRRRHQRSPVRQACQRQIVQGRRRFRDHLPVNHNIFRHRQSGERRFRGKRSQRERLLPAEGAAQRPHFTCPQSHRQQRAVRVHEAFAGEAHQCAAGLQPRFKGVAALRAELANIRQHDHRRGILQQRPQRPLADLGERLQRSPQVVGGCQQRAGGVVVAQGHQADGATLPAIVDEHDRTGVALTFDLDPGDFTTQLAREAKRRTGRPLSVRKRCRYPREHPAVQAERPHPCLLEPRFVRAAEARRHPVRIIRRREQRLRGLVLRPGHQGQRADPGQLLRQECRRFGVAPVRTVPEPHDLADVDELRADERFEKCPPVDAPGLRRQHPGQARSFFRIGRHLRAEPVGPRCRAGQHHRAVLRPRSIDHLQQGPPRALPPPRTCPAVVDDNDERAVRLQRGVRVPAGPGDREDHQREESHPEEQQPQRGGMRRFLAIVEAEEKPDGRKPEPPGRRGPNPQQPPHGDQPRQGRQGPRCGERKRHRSEPFERAGERLVERQQGRFRPPVGPVGQEPPAMLAGDVGKPLPVLLDPAHIAAVHRLHSSDQEVSLLLGAHEPDATAEGQQLLSRIKDLDEMPRHLLVGETAHAGGNRLQRLEEIADQDRLCVALHPDGSRHAGAGRSVGHEMFGDPSEHRPSAAGARRRAEQPHGFASLQQHRCQRQRDQRRPRPLRLEVGRRGVVHGW